MFETYYYIDEEKLDCYLSDFCRHPKLKKGKINVALTLPFIKIDASGEYTRDIGELSSRQKMILLESLLENNENELFFDLSNPDVDITTIPQNTFVKISCKLAIPKMIGLINGATNVLNSELRDFAQSQIKLKTEEENADVIMSLFSKKKSLIPVIGIFDSKFVSDVNINNIKDDEELDFWDLVAEDCEIIAKVTKNCSTDKRVKVFDIGKSYFGLSRAIRHSIDNYEDDENFNIYEKDVALRLEILSIRR